MPNNNNPYIFPGHSEELRPFVVSYSIDQYLVVDSTNNLVQAILTILDPGLIGHDYGSNACDNHLFNGLGDLKSLG